MSTDDDLSRSASLVRALFDQFQRAGARPQLVETHISWVLLAGEFAYKLKKPVRLGFLDFSTLAARRHYCEEELRLNRRLAAALYIGVESIHGDRDAPTWGGPGPVLDYAVKMHRMAADALAGAQLARDSLTQADLAQFAQRLADFHRAAPVAAADSPHATPGRIVDDALRPLAALPAGDAAEQGADLAAWLTAQAPQLHAIWMRRREQGRVRECHGDLHLDNVIRLDDGYTGFDCIEFDDGLRWIDVLSDVAFLTMDLQAHGRPDLASGFLNAYLEASGDYDGLPVLRFYMVYRAAVRALVASLRAAQGSRPAPALLSSHYLALALRLSRQWDPRLLIAHGLPGSGKSFVSWRLATCSGAIRVRSDVERRRLLGSGHYGTADTQGVYARLGEVAACALAAGYPTLVDAACLRRAERDNLRRLAAAQGVPFAILDCVAPDDVLRQRLRARAARGDDPSEADEAVLETLRGREQPLQPDELARTITVDTQQPLSAGALAAAWQRQTPEQRP